MSDNILYTSETLIKGRSSSLTITHKNNNHKMELINVYAPNITNEKITFFEEVYNKLKDKEITNPVLLGDFNYVEEAIDRWPEHTDDNRIQRTINRIKRQLHVQDGWRYSHPHDKEFTFEQQSTNSRARIDRIYINKLQYENSTNWNIVESGTLSDHNIPITTLIKNSIPEIGKGLWRIQGSTIIDEEFKKIAHKIINKTMTKITREGNAQTEWRKAKEEIKKEAQKIERTRKK
ncbi:hypothetical protein AMATHDRAFT_163768, partial [Amanita thiersii Skay4041]